MFVTVQTYDIIILVIDLLSVKSCKLRKTMPYPLPHEDSTYEIEHCFKTLN